MKKLSPKKLVLHRETIGALAHLQEALLERVGGATSDPWASQCCQTGTNCDISFCICQ